MRRVRVLALSACTLPLLLSACTREEAKAPTPAAEAKRVHGASPATAESAEGHGGIAIVRPARPVPGTPPKGPPRVAPGTPVPEGLQGQVARAQGTEAGEGGPAQAKEARAKALYFEGYAVKDSEPAEAVEKFRAVTQLVPADNAFHQKAQRWLKELGAQGSAAQP